MKSRTFQLHDFKTKKREDQVMLASGPKGKGKDT